MLGAWRVTVFIIAYLLQDTVLPVDGQAGGLFGLTSQGDVSISFIP